jgi:phage baseplate assembly protein W
VKLELTRPALERLIGGDTELEVGLRKQIVHEFTRRHLAELCKEEAMLSAVALVRQTASEIVRQEVDITGLLNQYGGSELGQRMRQAIQQAAEKAVDECVAERLKSWERHIEYLVTKSLKSQIDAEVKRQIAAAVETLIRERVAEAMKAIE